MCDSINAAFFEKHKNIQSEWRKAKMVELRLRRYTKMSVEELQKLNCKVCGRGPNWATQERHDICAEIGVQMEALFGYVFK